MAHTLATQDEPMHGVCRETGRGYTVIGWIRSDRGSIWPVLVPDEIALGEPLPIRAERLRGATVIIPDGM